MIKSQKKPSSSHQENGKNIKLSTESLKAIAEAKKYRKSGEMKFCNNIKELINILK